LHTVLGKLQFVCFIELKGRLYLRFVVASI